MEKKRIVLTGGGTAGHVTPNLALIPHLQKMGYEVHYIGTHDGMERGLIEPVEGVTYHAVHSGKLRRYFDLKNISDPFRVMRGVGEAASIIKKLRPRVVFAKGGFVSVPVVYGARLRGVPVVLHESDLTPGLANKLCAPFANVLCTTFPETAKSVKNGVYTGTPLREELFAAAREEGLKEFGLSGEKPVLMMTGGSSGAVSVNQCLRQALPLLLPMFDVLHLCGKGNVDESAAQKGYVQVEYLSGGMAKAFAAADLLVSRAGSNTLAELLALRKPNLLIPYPSSASRGDQIENAASFEKRGFSMVLPQADMTPESLAERVRALWENRMQYVRAMQEEKVENGVAAVLNEIEKAALK